MSELIEFAEKLRSQVDIVQVVEPFVPLKRAGVNYKGVCPFHREKTPSFSVSPTKQIFYCFGCGAGGDAIKFIQKIERVEWIEALKYLAEKFHIPMPELRRSPKESAEARGERDRFLAINELAASHFSRRLQTAITEGKSEIAQYIADRGLDANLVKQFRIGVAADAWSDFLDAALKAGYERDSLAAAGLVIHNPQSQRHYDRFRKRLIFPISDQLGRPVAFGGRVYARDAAPDEPKYVNSPETPLYRKGQHLYALHIAKDPIVKAQRALLMEGYMDVIRAHQHGFNTAVASCGTALTEEQARTLKRYCASVTFVYDGDEAGQKAMLRGCEVLLEQDFSINIVALPDDHDPDSYLRKHGSQAFQALVDQAPDFFQFFRHTAGTQFDRNSVEGKVRIVEFLMPLLAKVKSAVARDEYIRRVADFVLVGESVIRQQLASHEGRRTANLREQLAESARATEYKPENMLLRVIVESPEARTMLLDKVDPEWLGHPLARKWLGFFKAQDVTENYSWNALLSLCEDETDTAFLSSLAVDDEALDISERTLHNCLSRIFHHHRRRQTSLLCQQIREFYEQDPESAECGDLIQALNSKFRNEAPPTPSGFFLPRQTSKNRRNH
ncbi:MAG: DNA primase [Candidatus Sumerlaeaceae bacterium]|nr:DNA primase [Candidatus Sumerlaeaceae bacterium]